jgi:adenylate cyclase class 2
METEYEAKFLNIDKDEVRARLTAAGAHVERAEYLQKRYVFELPLDKSAGTYARVRDEGGTITMTWKRFAGTEVDNPEEIELIVDNFKNAVEFLEAIGCTAESFQESYRELWSLDETKITIDTWPFMEPFVEIEGAGEAVVRAASEKAGFDWQAALFCGVSKLFQMKYGNHVQIRKMPKLMFEMENPFV